MSATKRNIILGWIALLSAYLFSAMFSNGYIFPLARQFGSLSSPASTSLRR